MASENKQSTITNGVVITVYIESPKTRLIKPSEDPTKKTKPHPRFRMPQSKGTQGYDRRAQLLAYSRQLRENVGSQINDQVQLAHNQSRPRTKATETEEFVESIVMQRNRVVKKIKIMGQWIISTH
ncbi:hypothetical protein Fmac_031631 [Flemingia macrophylla]|uniref:Uncharacterized protein n=1 Tax=Flemingia macrophylla TaxID=520843 RepID=A0ABD1L2L2_9FABA